MPKKDTEGLSAIPNFSSLANSQATAGGGNILSSIFGYNASGILGTISKFAGIKDSSASSLMSMDMPAMLGLLGKHAEQNNMTPGGLSGFLSSQKDHILGAMPSGLGSLGGMLGLGGAGVAVSSMASRSEERRVGKECRS